MYGARAMDVTIKFYVPPGSAPAVYSLNSYVCASPTQKTLDSTAQVTTTAAGGWYTLALKLPDSNWHLDFLRGSQVQQAWWGGWAR
jgi:hypothetical protein